VTPPSLSANRRPVIAAILIILALGGGLGLIFHAQTKADDENESESAINPPGRLTIKNGIAILTLSAADQQNAGIETSHLSLSPEQDYIRGFATMLDAGALTDLSTQYRDAEAQVQAADARLAVSGAAFERAQILYKDQQNISTAQLQSAQSSFEIDTGALAAARARVIAVAASARQAWGGVIGTALVNQAPLIADLIERRSYLVKVTLPPGVVISAPPETASSLNAGADIRLTFVSLATAADPKLQGISYFYTTPAQDALLPGLNLEVSLAAKGGDRGLIVPDSAVVWLEGEAWIYLRTGPNTFVRREIAPNRPAPNDGYIVTGLPSDSEIAVRGAQMLLSEEFRAEVPEED
jgi:hypothetical protein